MALGMLAKGPIAPVLAAVVIVAFAAAAKEWRLVLKTLWLPGIMLFCAVALPWYVAVQMANPQFFREFILQHNLARFSSDLSHHPEPFWYYLPVTFLPWCPDRICLRHFTELVRAWWNERKSSRPEPDLELQFRIFACCWLAVPVLFFFALAVETARLHSSCSSGRSHPAGGLSADSVESNASIPKPLALLHAVVACAPIVPAVLVGFIVAQHRLPAGRPLLFALSGQLHLVRCDGGDPDPRMQLLRFVTLISVVLAVAAVLKLGTTAIDEKLSTRPLAVELASVETHKLPIAVCGASREVEYGLAFYRNQVVTRYETGDVPAEEHLLVAPTAWIDNVAKATAGRHVSLLGHYAPQKLDYYWVSAAGKR